MNRQIIAMKQGLRSSWRSGIHIAMGLCMFAVLSAAGAPPAMAGDIQVVNCDIATAITTANTSAGNRVLIPQGTCTLSAPLPTVTQPMTIQGLGSGAVIDAGTTNKRVLTIDSSGAINLTGLTIRNGKNTSDPATAGSVQALGGGISWNANGGTLTIDTCTIDSNTTSLGDGGGIAAYDSLAGGNAKLVIKNSTISNNTATDGAGGGIFVGQKVDLVMTNTTVQGNKAGYQTTNFGQGGGLFLFGPAGATGSSISDGAFNNNSATGDGGAIYTTAPIAITTTYSGNSVGANGNGPDLWNNANGAFLLTTDTSPIISAGGTVTFTEHDQPVVIAGGFTSSDGDNANLVSATVTISAGYIQGNDKLVFAGLNEVDDTVTAKANGSITGSYNDTTGTLTLQGVATKEKYQAALRSVTFNNNTHYLPITPTPRTITYVVNDGKNSSTAVTSTVNVIGVNDAPVLALASPVLPGITEDDTTNTGQLVSIIIGSTITDLDYNLTYNPVPLPGIAVIAAVPGNGTWQYSLDNNSSWVNFGAVADTTALLLRPTDYVRFLPNGQNGTSANFTYRAWDQSDGNSGGSKANIVSTGGSAPFSIGSNTASITVASVNDAPAFTGNGTLAPVVQGTANPPGATVSAIFGPLFLDVDDGASMGGIVVTGNAANAGTEGKWQYSTDSGTNWFDIGTVSDAGALALSAATKVRFLPLAPYYGNPGVLTVRAVDNTYPGSWTAGGSRSTPNVTVNGGTTSYASVARSLVTSITPAPDLTVTKTHVGNFTQGDMGDSYTITVSNSGGSPTSGTVTVVDTLPTGLTATAISGAAWSCDLGTLTCSRSDALANGNNYPAITITVNVAASAAASITNNVTVSGGGELKTDNNTASDVTTVLPTVPVAAVATSVTDSSFSSNWGALANATGYYLDVALDSGFTSFVTGYNNRDVANVATFAVTGLAPATNYFYRVRMHNANGTSTNSNVISVSTRTGKVSAVVLDPVTPATLYAGIDGGGIYRSIDSGSSWLPTAGQPGNLRVQALAVNPTINTTLYAATYGGGVFISTTGGDSWSACTNASPGSLNALTLAIDVAGTLYAGTEGGIFTSPDCATWSPANTGLTVNSATPPVAIAIDPATSATLYAGLNGAGIFRSGTSGTSWSPATTQPSSLNIRALVISKTDGTILYSATYGGGVFTSTDSGDTWNACVNTGLTNLNVVSLTIDAGGRLYAGTEAGVFVSNDGCATWTATGSGQVN